MTHRISRRAFPALALAAALPPSMRGADSRRPRFFYNDDGDRPFYRYSAPFHIRHFLDQVDVLIGTPVTTLCYCVGDSQVYYPSKVASQPGWRKTATTDSTAEYRRWYRVATEIRRQGVDPIRAIMERAAESGIEFIPSLRMNDGHFAQKGPPAEHLLTARFWMEHQDLTINKADPSVRSWPGFLLDFTHREVREYRMAQIREIIDRYAAGGLELDFTRHYQYFPPGRQRPDLITEMVAETRRLLDARSRRRPLALIVRTPGSLNRDRPDEGVLVGWYCQGKCPLDLCREQGLDVVRWMRDGLIDYVVPSNTSRAMCLDMPVSDFVEAAKGTRCQVYASPESASTRGDRVATVEMYRAAMANYYRMGQHGAYLFNFFTRHYPLTAEDYGILREVSSAKALRGRDKHFMATPESFLPGEHLPVRLEPSGAPKQIGVYVGDDLAAGTAEKILKDVRLRIRIEGAAPEEQVEIRLNGHELSVAAAAIERPDLGEFRKQPQNVWEQIVTKGPFTWLTFDVTRRPVRLGENIVEITRRQKSSPSPLVVTAVDVLVRYDPEPPA
ncbi:MAG: hypothetical protein ACKV22_07455 [Bryobacteraceae bacterium]